MENVPEEQNSVPNPKVSSNYQIRFHGSYKQYFGLSLYNILLTIITLGIYYPWAKCAIRKFLWEETEIAGSRFKWHGTGMEMFRGFIKAYFILGSLLIIINFGPLFLPPSLLIWFIVTAYLAILALIPLIIHGMARYRLSRTSFRGISCGYDGKIGGFYALTSKDFFLTIITLGIYGFWFQTNVRRYVLQHSRFGNVHADFDGTGGDLFGLSIVQGLLTAITFYIYLPWALVAFFKFYVDNTSLRQDDKSYYFKSFASGGEYFIVLIKSFFIVVLTLGIATPIAQLMIHKFFVESIQLKAGFDFDKVEQDNDNYADASGDDMGDILDIDF